MPRFEDSNDADRWYEYQQAREEEQEQEWEEEEREACTCEWRQMRSGRTYRMAVCASCTAYLEAQSETETIACANPCTCEWRMLRSGTSYMIQRCAE